MRQSRQQHDDDGGFGFAGMDDGWVRAEKAKARELRATRWWQQKIAAGVCHYCGQRFPPRELTMDHIVPLARGGRSVKSNLVPSCKACNSQKKVMLPGEWENER